MITKVLTGVCAFYLFVYLPIRFTFRKVIPGFYMIINEEGPRSEKDAARMDDARYAANWRGDAPFYYGTMYPGGNEPGNRRRSRRAALNPINIYGRKTSTSRFLLGLLKTKKGDFKCKGN